MDFLFWTWGTLSWIVVEARFPVDFFLVTQSEKQRPSWQRFKQHRATWDACPHLGCGSSFDGFEHVWDLLGGTSQ